MVLLEDGRVVAEGTHAELMRTEPRYAEVLAHARDDDADEGTDQLEDEDDLSYRRRIALSVARPPDAGIGGGPAAGGGPWP